MKINLKNLFGFFLFSISLLHSIDANSKKNNWGNTFITGGSETIVYGQFHFVPLGGGMMEGIIGTERTSPMGVLSFWTGSSWTNASNVAHVDGYVKDYQTGFFIFPIGDNGFYRAAAVSKSSLDNPTTAAYFNASPSSAITTSLKGGNEPLLPAGAPFNINSFDKNLSVVSSIEYWDINGTTSAKISLTWESMSNINSLTSGKLQNLTIAGWDGAKWVNIPSTIDAVSILGNASNLTAGSITTNSEITPDAFSVYTLASVKDRILVSTKVYLQGAWNGTSMNTTLNSLNLIPLKQPYNQPPFNYSGTETVASIPSDVVDWVLVKLLSNDSQNTLLGTRAAFLRSNGMVVDLDGTSPVEFKGLSSGNYKIAVFHRNHIPVLSSSAVPVSYDEDNVQLYDFTTSQNQAYQNTTISNTAMVNLANNGFFGLWGADGNSNGRTSYIGVANDEYYLSAVALNALSVTTKSNVYSNGDYNMDGTVSYTGNNSDEVFLLSTVLGGNGTSYILRHF